MTKDIGGNQSSLYFWRLLLDDQNGYLRPRRQGCRLFPIHPLPFEIRFSQKLDFDENKLGKQTPICSVSAPYQLRFCSAWKRSVWHPIDTPFSTLKKRRRYGLGMDIVRSGITFFNKRECSKRVRKGIFIVEKASIYDILNNLTARMGKTFW